jgi:hypothetical protein
MWTSDDAGGADQAALQVALFVQRNFEKMLAAFDDDDRGIGRFAASRQRQTTDRYLWCYCLE